MATRIGVKGSIISGGASWLYDFLGISYTASEEFIRQLEAANGDDVIVEINSPGGYVAPAAEIYEAIRTYSGNIECRVVGQAASAASIIACAAKSSITPMGTFFMHNCIGGAQGNHNDMRQAMQTMESIDENIMEAYRAKTGMSDAEIYALMEENTTLNAKRAVELGFIDRITESAADVAQAAGVSAGIAASATGFVDLMAMDADHLAAIRELYENSKQASCEGGETMEIEDIQNAEDEPIEAEAEETAEEPTEGEAEEVGADEGDQAEEADDDATEGETEQDGDEADGDADDEQAAYDRGVLAERARIAAIMEIAARVPDAMVQAALFTEPISAEQLALQAMRAEDAQRTGYMDKARADVKASNSAKVAAEVTDAPSADSRAEQKQMLEKALTEKFSK